MELRTPRIYIPNETAIPTDAVAHKVAAVSQTLDLSAFTQDDPSPQESDPGNYLSGNAPRVMLPCSIG